MEINITLTPAEKHLLDHIGTETQGEFLERMLHAALVKRIDFLEKFESRIDKTGDCWIWIAGRTPFGYGNYRNPETGKNDLAHRISYRMHKGPIPAGLVLLHSCDVPACVNPDHLTIGTYIDNSRDMYAKGRQHHHTKAKGESHGRAKLNQQQVDEIKHLASTGLTNSEISRRFQVTRMAISRIVNGKGWKDNPDKSFA